MKKLEQHETIRRGFEVEHVRTGAVHARGSIAYAQVYNQQEEKAAQHAEALLIRELKGHRPRNWVVERLHDGRVWVSADKATQCSSFESALRFVSGLSQYRVRRLYGRGH